MMGPCPCLVAKTVEPAYQDPFDLAAGGASLTRASKEGVVFSNPALLRLASGFIRWIGSSTNLLVNKESVDTARKFLPGGSTQSSQSSGTNNAEALDLLLKNPLRIGWGQAVSLITRSFGGSFFSRFEVDFAASQYGASGLPEIAIKTESYNGFVLGAPIPVPIPWLYLGLTGKYLFASEESVSADVADQTQITKYSDPNTLKSLYSQNSGAGVDAGALLFLQSGSVDFSLAAKVDDIGNTKLTGDSLSPKSLKQVASVGTGLTLHTGDDMIHFAVDYRDIGNAYGEPLFKRVYAGTKVTVRQMFGVAAGYYNGYPSMGAVVDLFFFRLALTSYTRELGDHPGVAPRHVYLTSISAGF
jgi:hypothetical protein